MSDKHTIVEGDAAKVPVRMAPGPKDGAPQRPDGGTQLVFGGAAPQSPWDLLANLIGEGGEVQYTLVNSAALARLQKKGQKPGTAPPKVKPAEKKKEEQPATPPPNEDVHPAAVSDLFIHGHEFRSKDPHGKEQPARVWAHAAAPGAKRPLVVYLHGINRPQGKPYPQLQDEIETTNLVHVGLLAKKLIGDGKVEPLVIAAPTCEKDFTGQGKDRHMVLWSGFDLGAFVEDVRKELKDHGIEIDDERVAVVGHSGAGCNGGGGMLLLARQGAKFGGKPIRVFGLADTCITESAVQIVGEGQKKFDPHTIVYCMHQGWGGSGKQEGYAGAKLGSTIGAKHRLGKTSAHSGESDLDFSERWEDVDDGGDARRISLKLSDQGIWKHEDVWLATGAAKRRSGMWAHYAVTLHWTWAALQRFFPRTSAPDDDGENPPRADGGDPPADAGDFDHVPAGPPPWTAPASPRSHASAAFAHPGGGRVWPVRTNSFSGRAVSFIGDDGQEYGAANAPHRAAHREFLARHEGDQGDWYNSGVELYADYGDPVVACESGTVVAFEPFWGDLHRVLLSCASGAVIGYAGLEADSLDLLGLKSGMTVKAGQQVGTVGQVENGQAMLMFETYVAATRTGAVVRDTPAAAAGRLLDPTAYLIALAKGGR